MQVDLLLRRFGGDEQMLTAEDIVGKSGGTAQRPKPLWAAVALPPSRERQDQLDIYVRIEQRRPRRRYVR